MRETVWHVAIILLITGTVFFTNLGGSRLWDRDEPRNAGCAAEMMERGDWVVPMFNGELRHQKPVLLYWLIISAYSVMGVNEFSARFWSAALAIGTTLATYGIARRLINPRVGLYAAIALATSLMFDVAARAVTPDSLLMFCGTTALLTYVLATFSRSADGLKLKRDGVWFPQALFPVCAIYALLGLGVLAKGPVGFLLPMAIIGLFMLINTLPVSESRIGDSILEKVRGGLDICWRVLNPIHFLRTVALMRPILGTAIVLLIAAPWYLLVDVRTEGDFTQMFFVGEHFGRATTAMESHRGGLWFYPLAILVGFFPWSIFWGPVAVGLWKSNGNRGKIQGASNQGVATSLMLCWIGVQVGAFSLAQTKLPSYVTPCYPALAVLTAVCLNCLAINQLEISRRWFYAAFGGLAFSGLLIILAVGVATMKFMPNQFWLASLGLVPLVGGLVLIGMMRSSRTKSVPVVFSLTALLFSVGLFGFGTVSLDREQQSHHLLNRIEPGVAVGTYGLLESSWVFYANRTITELISTEFDSTEFDSTQPASDRGADSIGGQQFWKPKPQQSVESFLESNPDGVLITTDEHFETIKKRLPEDYEVLQTAEYFLKNKQLLLLGRSSSNADHLATQTASESAGSIQR